MTGVYLTEFISHFWFESIKMMLTENLMSQQYLTMWQMPLYEEFNNNFVTNTADNNNYLCGCT